MAWWTAWLGQARAGCAGRPWPGYALLLAALAWFCIGPMFDPGAWSPVAMLSLAVHEAGHFTTRFWAPAFLSVAAGSLFQWGAPVLCGWLLWRQGEVFGVAVGLIWLGMSLGQSVAYIADASAMELPLVSVGAYHPDTHDWNYMLDALGLLGHEGFLAGLCRLASIVAMLAGLACGGWMTWTMAASARGGDQGREQRPR